MGKRGKVKYRIEGGPCEGPANDPMNTFELVGEADSPIQALFSAHIHDLLPEDLDWVSVFLEEGDE